MATTGLTIAYRPVRLGLLVRSGNLDDLVAAAGLNTMLAGGIYNPLLPVGADNELAKDLIRLFNVDVLHAVTSDPSLDAYPAQHPLLVFPNLISGKIVSQALHDKGNQLNYLDSLHLIERLWESEFKHKPENYKSDFALITWSPEDRLRYLFSLTFGFFPDGYNLVDNFQDSFLRGLHAKEIDIQVDSPIDPAIGEVYNQLNLTGIDLQGYKGSFKGEGVYIGDESSFDDLVAFWNLRAAGLYIEFLPINNSARVESLVNVHIADLDQMLDPRIPEGEDWVTYYYQSLTRDKVDEVVKTLTTKKRKVLYQCGWPTWNGLNIKASKYYYNYDHSTAAVEKSYDRYMVTINLEETPGAKSQIRDMGPQELAVSIKTFSEYGYEHTTLKPPYIPELNEYYSTEIALEPHKLRVEEDGIDLMIQTWGHSLLLFTLPYLSLIKKIFEYAGIKSETSRPGLITGQIIEKLGGLEAGNIFKTPGVRTLIQRLKPDQGVTKGGATKLIKDNSGPEKQRGRYSDPNRAFKFLLETGFFRAGLELICEHCRLENWLNLKDIDDLWPCTYCGGENKTSLQLKDRGDWKFRKSGFLAKDNNQEGAIPVILTLLQFKRRLGHYNFVYSTALDLQIDSKKFETDLCVLQYERGRSIEVGIAECKSQGGEIEQEDIDNLKSARAALIGKQLDCVLIFAKTANEFTADEMERFRTLAAEEIPMILLTNRELEPFDPYADFENIQLPHRYAFTLSEMALNSRHIYLTDLDLSGKDRT